MTPQQTQSQIQAPQPPNPETISQSLITEESDDEVELLKYTGSKNLYLTKVGLVFCVYYLVCCISLTMIYMNPEGFRQKYFKYRVFNKTWTFLYIIIAIKVFMSFLGRFVRGLSTIFFLIDCYLINTFALSLYFYLEGYLQTQYTSNGFWVLAFAYALFGSSVGFVLSAMFKDNKRVYNFILGIALMSLFAAGALKAAVSIYNVPNFHNTQFTIVLATVIAYSVYFAINSYQVITFRTEKFYDDEFSYCFFCYFTDWFTFFWIDMFRDASFHRLKQKAENLARVNLKKHEREEKKGRVEMGAKAGEMQDTHVGRDVEVNDKDNSF